MKVTKCDLCEGEIPASRECLTHRLVLERGTGLSMRYLEAGLKQIGEPRSLTSVFTYGELCDECAAQITTALQLVRNERRKKKQPIYIGPLAPPEGEGI